MPTIWMSGPPAAVAKGQYTNGPTPSFDKIRLQVHPGEIVVGKDADTGAVVNCFRQENDGPDVLGDARRGAAKWKLVALARDEWPFSRAPSNAADPDADVRPVWAMTKNEMFAILSNPGRASEQALVLGQLMPDLVGGALPEIPPGRMFEFFAHKTVNGRPPVGFDFMAVTVAVDFLSCAVRDKWASEVVAAVRRGEDIPEDVLKDLRSIRPINEAVKALDADGLLSWPAARDPLSLSDEELFVEVVAQLRREEATPYGRELGAALEAVLDRHGLRAKDPSDDLTPQP